MAEYTPKTICELIQEIDEGRVVLPAMQRNFVWEEAKICSLFESIMRDYPIGTFLFWMIDEDLFKKYVFNTFIRDYDEEKGKMQRGNKATASFSDYTAVLDGQQRITSLYMGIKGKYRTHIRGKNWERPDSYFDRYLCIDILFVPNAEEEYHFEFQPEGKIDCFTKRSDGKDEYWVKVSRVFNAEDASSIPDIIDEIPENNNVFPLTSRKEARKILTALFIALKKTQNVNYYSAKTKSLTEVVDIFVRVNSGGQKLDSSDLMLSVATGEQGDIDIHVLIQEAVEEINNVPKNVDEGFKVDKELLLTSGLLFTGADSLSLKNSENYTPNRMNEIFKKHWDSIIDALKTAVDYVEFLGFVGKKLSRNSILPIAYYFYKNQILNNHKFSILDRAHCDRVFIRQWLLRAIINGMFSDGTGSTLLQIRRIIDKTTKNHFPLEDFLKTEIKKPLKIEGSQIEEILDIRYGDTRIIPLFNELEHVASRQNDQVDHIWARGILSSKKAIKKLYPSISDAEVEKYKAQLNRLANLQVLNSLENNEKSDKPFDEWFNAQFNDPEEKNNYCRTHFIPIDVPYGFDNFLSFLEKRENLLKQKIESAFPSDINKLIERYALKSYYD
jgi:hypothetical protein